MQLTGEFPQVLRHSHSREDTHMNVRAGEHKRTWFRCKRIIHTGAGWFFITRENTEQGPFPTEQDARSELDSYIENAGCRIVNRLH